MTAFEEKVAGGTLSEAELVEAWRIDNDNFEKHIGLDFGTRFVSLDAETVNDEGEAVPLVEMMRGRRTIVYPESLNHEKCVRYEERVLARLHDFLPRREKPRYKYGALTVRKSYDGKVRKAPLAVEIAAELGESEQWVRIQMNALADYLGLNLLRWRCYLARN